MVVVVNLVVEIGLIAVAVLPSDGSVVGMVVLVVDLAPPDGMVVDCPGAIVGVYGVGMKVEDPVRGHSLSTAKYE